VIAGAERMWTAGCAVALHSELAVVVELAQNIGAPEHTVLGLPAAD
jgi:hypothetical protein